MIQTSLLEKLNSLVIRFEEIGKLITDPSVISDLKRYVKLNKEYKELEAITNARNKYKLLLDNIDEAKFLIDNENDIEIKQLAKEQLEDSTNALSGTEEEIKLLLTPSDPEDSKNAIVEIRGGTGGDEAALFAGDLYKMYIRYCESKGWKIETTDYTEGTSGGYKEIIMKVSGSDVYGILKYESGVHRVQRIPSTETQGRVHTSAATVAVLPEAEEFDIELKDADIRVDTFCASGNGGQSVNTTYSAVRLVHIPTGITVQCQDEKSQIKNRAKALVELRTRIYNMEYQKYLDDICSKRKTMVSTGDRSAKIRTYNYPQGRITDHRINETIYNLSAFMSGEIQPLLNKLIVAENAERLKESEL